MDKLLFHLERCYRLTGIPLRVMDHNMSITLYSRGYNEQYDLLNDKMKGILDSKLRQTDVPFLEFESDLICYGAMRDTTETFIIAGPVLLRQTDEITLKRYATEHEIPYHLFSIKSKSLLELCALLSLLYGIRTGLELTETEIVSQTPSGEMLEQDSNMRELLPKDTDSEIARLNYADELHFLQDIREGNVENINQAYNGSVLSPHDYGLGKMAKKPIKHFEYMVCSSITLAARAATQGGLEPRKSYALSDLYLQRLETCKTVEEILTLHCSMQEEYARQVRRAKTNRSKVSYVEKAKSYIASHVSQPYELEDIIQELGISKAYLSKKFHEEMGMGVMRYARKFRVEAAANMLKYSSESISNIASHLCFQSQSHFGVVFKEFMGTTPQKYRESEQPNL